MSASCGCCGGVVRGICYRCRATVATRRCACRCGDDVRPLLPPSPATRMALGAITLQQPWATCCIPGPKDTENRKWELPMDPAGRWLGLHAGLRFDEGVDEMVHQYIREIWPEMPAFADMPLGAMLGVVHVLRCDQIEAVTELSPWASGPVGWRIDYRIALPKPIPCRGAQGVWLPPPEVASRLWALFPRPLDPPPVSAGPPLLEALLRQPSPAGPCSKCGQTGGHNAMCESLPYDRPFDRAR